MAAIRRLIVCVRILARDNRIPKPLRGAAALGLLPLPGPLDEVILLLVAIPLLLFYRQSLREAWQQAAPGTGSSSDQPAAGSGGGQPMAWLPESFRHPERVDLPTGHHLRPIRAADVDIDYPAVMGSRERLWAKYGEAWGWPPATMTLEQDREDLTHHEAEIANHETFNYAVLNTDESELLGCVYIDPPAAGDESGSDAIVSWWVVDDADGAELERELEEFLPRWLNDTWGFQAVDFSP